MINKYFKKYDVLQAAIDAGIAIMEMYETGNYTIKKKHDSSLLTEADERSHDILVKRLSDNYNYPLLSEEGKETSFEIRKKWKRFWLIDPLDGTKEFVDRNGEFTVNIALIENGISVEGVIYAPNIKTLYFGSDLGAFKVEQCPENIKEIKEYGISKMPQVEYQDKFVIACSRSHMNDETHNYVNQMKAKHDNVELLSVGSSLKLCMVADGIASSYPRYAPTMEWDTAAGDAICRSVGLEVKNYNTGKPIEYNKSELLNPWFLVCRND
jgi:3'(2'), 5'-bisphosphate nucleotidase